MPTQFFTAPGRFLRGNLHTHSTGSDGIYSPQEVCDRYRAEGYDFIALTDHLVGLFDYPITDTRACRNADFTTIIGAELHTGVMSNGNLWHLLGIGLPLDFKPPHAPHFKPVDGSESATSIARRAREAGALVVIAHPHWSGMSQADALTITAAHAVEVYNHGCVVDNDRGEGFLIFEHLLNQGIRLNLIAADDAHFNTPDHFGGWVMVKAVENTPSALLKALKEGAYYASTGPDFQDIRFIDGAIEVECSPASTIVVQGKGTSTATLHGTDMTHERLSLARVAGSPWLRVTISDKAGKRAWSNPIWIGR
jgi:hypothetical protein